MKIYFLKIIFALVLFTSPFIAFAGDEHNISGWAWASKNVGWISFNSKDCDTDGNGGVDSGRCGGDNSPGSIVNYGVDKDVNGNFVGYAWAPNVGWIQFGGLSGFPTGPGTFPQDKDARVVGNQLRGWAKAVAATSVYGWDGWISLTGTGKDYTTDITGKDFSYGVTQSGTNFTGYAWGSNVVGAIDFDLVTSGASNFWADPNPCTIPEGQSACNPGPTLEWNVTNPSVIDGSSITSDTNNNGQFSLGFQIVSSVSTPPLLPTGGTFDSGEKENVQVRYPGRIFKLHNDEVELGSVNVTTRCAPGTSWHIGTDSCKKQFRLNVLTSGTGIVKSVDGKINCGAVGGPCSAIYISGTNVILEAIPGNGATFTGWTGACTNSSDPRCAFTVQNNTTVTATFTSTNLPPPSGSCSSPMRHYFCAGDTTIGTGTEQPGSSLHWSWTCGTSQCSEIKDLDFEEN